MSQLSALQKKQAKLVIGLVSGTSADGIDAVLVRITGSGAETRVNQLAFETYRYPADLQATILNNSLPGSGSVDLVCELNVLVAHFFADAAKNIARKGRVKLSEIDLIGSHGQTIHHLPEPKRLFGKSIRSGLQIGDPSTIAKLTGVMTVGDFRMGDMAVGGQGAPLAPYLDTILFRSNNRNRILLNLGGIANFTALPKKCGFTDVLAFDTGPANMVIDALMKKIYKKQYDAGGRVALRGKVHQSLLSELMSHPYFKMRPPKSTGRELFGSMVLPFILREGTGMSSEDIIATVTRWTALSVFDQYKRFIMKRMKADEVIVSGGGVHNEAMMTGLADYFAPAHVGKIESVGFSSDAKEAILFAVLANEAIAERPGNMPRVTGARRAVVLGKICL